MYLLYESVIIVAIYFAMMFRIFGSMNFSGLQGVNFEHTTLCIQTMALYYTFVLLPIAIAISFLKSSKTVKIVLYAVIALLLNPISYALIIGIIFN